MCAKMLNGNILTFHIFLEVRIGASPKIGPQSKEAFCKLLPVDGMLHVTACRIIRVNSIPIAAHFAGELMGKNTEFFSAKLFKKPGENFLIVDS